MAKRPPTAKKTYYTGGKSKVDSPIKSLAGGDANAGVAAAAEFQAAAVGDDQGVGGSGEELA